MKNRLSAKQLAAINALRDEYLAKLHPDLHSYLYTNQAGYIVLNSPFVQRFGLNPCEMRDPVTNEPFIHDSPEQINSAYKQKAEFAATCLEKREWFRYLLLVERPYRLQKYLEISDKIPLSERPELLRHIWIDSENIWQWYGEWVEGLKKIWAYRKEFMGADNWKVFESLPERLTIYRAYTPKFKNRNGLSWTVDRAVAENFCGTIGRRHAKIRRVTVLKGSTFAYLNDREEQEVLVTGFWGNGEGSPKIEGDSVASQLLCATTHSVK